VNRERAQTKNPQDKLVSTEMLGLGNKKARRNCSVIDRTGTELPIRARKSSGKTKQRG